MGLFSAFSSSSSSSSPHPPPPPTLSSLDSPSSEADQPSSSSSRKVSPLDRKKSAGNIFSSSAFASSSKPPVDPVPPPAKGKKESNGRGRGKKLDVNPSSSSSDHPPPYSGSGPLPVASSRSTGLQSTRRESRESGASGEFVVGATIVSETGQSRVSFPRLVTVDPRSYRDPTSTLSSSHAVTTTTTTTFFPLFRRHHPPPPLPVQLKQQLPPPSLSTSIAPSAFSATPSSSSSSSAPPPPPFKAGPSSRAASQPHPSSSRSSVAVYPLPHPPDLPLIPPSSSRHVSAAADIGGGGRRRLSAEEKGKGKGLPELPSSLTNGGGGAGDVETKVLPRTPTLSGSSSKEDLGEEGAENASEKEPEGDGGGGEPPEAAGGKGERAGDTSLRVVTSALKAFVHRGPARGASIVVTPSSPLLGAQIVVPSDSNPGTPSSLSRPSTSSTPLPSAAIPEDFTTPPTHPSPLPIPIDRSTQRKLAHRTSQMSLGHGFPSVASSPPDTPPHFLQDAISTLPSTSSSPPSIPLHLQPLSSASSVLLGSSPSSSSSRQDLPTGPPMLIPPTFSSSSTATSILSTSSSAAATHLPVSFDAPCATRRPLFGRDQSHATLDSSSSSRPSVPHSLLDGSAPPTDIPSSPKKTKPSAKRMSSMDLFSSFTNSSSAAGSATAAAAGMDWRQRVKRRASASALGGAAREREKERARSKSGGAGAPVVPTRPNLPKLLTSPLIPAPSQPSSTKSTPSGGKRLSLWTRRGPTFDRIPTDSVASETSSPAQSSMPAIASLDAPTSSFDFTLPLFDMGKRFSLGDASLMARRRSAEEKQEVLVDSPTAEPEEDEALGLRLGLGVGVEEGKELREREELRVDVGGQTDDQSTTAKGGFQIDSTPSSPHPPFGQPSPTQSSSSGKALGPLFEHHPTSATTSTSSFPAEPSSTVSSSRSSTSINQISSTTGQSFPPPSPSSSLRSATLQRPALSPMRSNSSGSTSMGGRIRDSMFGASRPTTGRARSSSTLLGGSRKPNDGMLGLMDNLRPPSASSTTDPFGSGSGSAHSRWPTSPAESSGSGSLRVADEFGAAGFLSTDPAARSSFSSSPSRSNSLFRRPRSATSPPPVDFLVPGNVSPSKLRNRPLSIRRLSSALFDSAPPSPRRENSALLFPLPSRTSSSSSLLLSPSGRKSPSKRRESIASSVGSGVAEKERSRPAAEVPLREEEESPELWLKRLLEAVPKYEVANVLAVSGDEFHVAALRAYMSSFDFSGKPLDVALRRLLMEVALPRETQQIDRVMESFAKQYIEGNPGLFTNEDHPYILAFSLIMLHTDAFNKSNKNKMSKADYIKNTRLDGVLPEVLDTFFDNITFTPFVFVEDDNDLPSARSLIADSSLDPSTSLFSTSAGPSSGSNLLGTKYNKVDVYYLISENLTQTLRADVEFHIPLQDPFSYHGGKGKTSFDTAEVHASFLTADLIDTGLTGGAGGGVGARKASTGSLLSVSSESQTKVLRLTKFGVLSRKEDLAEGGKKALNRKWKDWSVILTGNQLLFFRDPALASVLQKQAEEQSGSRRGSEGSSRVLAIKLSALKPDEVLNVKDAIAITDTSYSKYPNAFRFVMPHGRQYLLQTNDESELTEWMARINYASAFKTASVFMRGMGMDSTQAQLTGKAAARSHTQALRSEDALSIKPSSGSVTTAGTLTPSTSTTQLNVNPFAEAFTLNPGTNGTPSVSPRAVTVSAPRSPLFTAPRLRSLSRPPAIDLESPIFAPEGDGGQLETAFMEIKAELAAGRGGATRLSTSRASEEQASRARAASVDASFSARSSFEKPHYSSRAGTNAVGGSAHASRTEALQVKVNSLQSKISATEMHLNAELRAARNLTVLTPFQRSTRDRIQLAVLPLAKKIRHLRMELARLRCYEEILRTDLQISSEGWKTLISIAHQAAQSSLSGESTPSKPLTIAGSLPSLEISLHTGTTPPRREPISIPQGGRGSNLSTSLRRSSIASFRTANENPLNSDNEDDPDQDHDHDQDDLPSSSSADPSTPPSCSWPHPLTDLAPATTPSPSRSRSPSPTPPPTSDPSDFDADRPTDWKASKLGHRRRVSLAQVPESTVRKISLRLRKESLDDMRSRHRMLQVTPANGGGGGSDGEGNGARAGTGAGGTKGDAGRESRTRSFARRASVGRRARSEEEKGVTSA